MHKKQPKSNHNSPFNSVSLSFNFLYSWGMTPLISFSQITQFAKAHNPMTTIINAIIPTPNQVQPDQYRVYVVVVALAVVVPYTYLLYV